MNSPLRILLLEDDPADAELALATLENDGIRCDALRVETRAEFVGALEGGAFDLVLSDNCLPSFDGFAALKIATEVNARRAASAARLSEIPFIFLSGTMGEECAIDSLKLGATDYVLKCRISRLIPAVRRAMVEADERSARREAEKARSEAESLFRSLFEQVTAGVAIAGSNGRILMANPVLESMLGYGKGELAQARLADLMHPEDSAAGTEAGEELWAGTRASYEFEKRFVRRNGAVRWARVIGSLIKHTGRRARSSINLIEDITDRREAEGRSLQAQKMEAVGRLAAGVAHDFNNVLTVINGYSQLLLDRNEFPDDARREVQEIRRAGERASTLTHRMLGFSRQQHRAPKVLDLNSIVTGIDWMLRRLIGDGIRLTIRLDAEAGFIEAEQTEIEQIIINLVLNARDAMPDGGELIIATENSRFDATAIDGVLPGECVVLAITDTGQGMDEATKARVFEPFFTTKEVGKGTGLGLWTALATVQQSKGAVTLHSEPGRGTSFRICLPRASRVPDGVTAPDVSSGQASLGESETILLVEDDDAVRELAHKILEAAGYRVLLARGGAEALETAHGRLDRIHLLITDVMMPKMSGTDLAARLWDGRPEMRVLFMSGYQSGAATGQHGAHPRSTHLQKPFTSDILLRNVRAMLDARPDVSIVIADDDPAVRSFLTDVLQPIGYRIREASNGRQAIQHLRQGPVHLLITDLVMPNQDGIETIQAVKKEFPAVRVLAMSGGLGEEFLDVARMLGAHDIIHKPFSADLIRETVRRLL